MKRGFYALGSLIAVILFLLILYGAEHDVLKQLKVLFGFYLTALTLAAYALVTTLLVGYLYDRAMYHFQRFEYKRHHTRIIITIAIVVLALVNLVWQFYNLCIFFSCKLSHQKYGVPSNGGLCRFVSEK